MERSEILATMSALKLYGMKAAFDEIIATYWLRVLERSWQRRMGVLAIQYEHAAR